jgi:hypothetical protein
MGINNARDDFIRSANVVTAAFYVVRIWEAGGSRSDVDFYSRMFALKLALIPASKPCEKWADVSDAAYDLAHYVMSRWEPSDPALPLLPDAMMLLNLALADVGRYPGGQEGADQAAVLAARKTLWETYEAINKKENADGRQREGRDPDAEVRGDGWGGKDREPEAPGGQEGGRDPRP